MDRLTLEERARALHEKRSAMPLDWGSDDDEIALFTSAIRDAVAARDEEWREAVRAKLSPHYPCRVDDKTACPVCVPLRKLMEEKNG